MADGYAQATGRPRSSTCTPSAGLGNAIGNLTNAQANGTPLVVTAGQQDERHLVDDPLLSGDLVGLAGAVRKWTHEVRSPDELGTILRRAFHDAAARRAVRSSCAMRMDHLDAEVDLPAPPRSDVDTARGRGGLPRLAQLLTEPRPGPAGDRRRRRGRARRARSRRSSRWPSALGAPVFGSPLYGRTAFPPSHPLWAGMLAPVGRRDPRGAGALPPGVPHRRARRSWSTRSPTARRCPTGTELIHLAPIRPNSAAPTRCSTARVGDSGHGEALTALLRECRPGRGRTGGRRRAAEQRRARSARPREATRARGATALRRCTDGRCPRARPRGSPDGIAVVDEAITTGVYVRGFHHKRRPTRTSSAGAAAWAGACRSSLGVSLGPAAAAGALRRGRRLDDVLAAGALDRGPRAAPRRVRGRRQRPVPHPQELLRGMAGTSVDRDRFVAMDLGDPAVDFVGLAASMGVDGSRVDSPTTSPGRSKPRSTAVDRTSSTSPSPAR